MGTDKQNPVERDGVWFETFSGVKFYPLDPRPEDILIEDIAHALSNQCRFAGQSRVHYSVAEHSLRVSHYVPQGCCPLQALLHDASEAYLVDLPSPIKYGTILGGEYRIIEEVLMGTIYRKFGVPEKECPHVHVADKIMAVTEKRDLMNSDVLWGDWVKEFPPMRTKIIPRPCDGRVEKMFLKRFKELTK